MRPADAALGKHLSKALVEYDRRQRSLPGINTKDHRDSLVEQLVESMRRVRYVTVMKSLSLGPAVADPSSGGFDPIKAAILRQREGQIDDAFWLVFLAVHFGKNLRYGWQLARDVYGALEGPHLWDWAHVSHDVKRFRSWLDRHQNALKPGGVVHFGNHRKYVSLSATSPSGTGAAVESYVRWVNPPRAHEGLFAESLTAVGGDPRRAFSVLYRSVNSVASFARMAAFDYLTMVGKLGLAPIEPGSAYITGATGPRSGASLLFTGSKSSSLTSRELDTLILELEAALNVGPMGMQVMEDALCNWQKSPARFQPFRG